MAKITMMAKKVEFTVENAMDDFIRYSKSKNLTESTLNNYKKQFRKFNLFYDGELSDINSQTVLEFIEDLQEQGLKPVSINTSLRHMKAILNYWADQNYIQPVKVKLMKVEEEIKDTYSEVEIAKLLKKPDIKNCSFTEFRTWAIINFVVGTGCRLSTLTNARIADVDFENELIAYRHTKNKKAQYVPLSKHLSKVLTEYLRYRKGEKDDLLFPSENNTQLVGTTVAHTVASYNRSRGVEKTSMHLFRHTFAKNWILQGGDPLRLQKVLGHSTLAMAQHYANLYKSDLKKGFEDFNLLSKFSSDKIKMK